MDDLGAKVSLSEAESMIPIEVKEKESEQSADVHTMKIIELLRKFLSVQQRRALAYASLKQGFEDYMVSRAELAYQKLCSAITVEFNDCSKQVLEIESLFLSPDYLREDLANLLRSVQAKEKEKLQLTVAIQVLKKAGPPSERLVSHENCKFSLATGHECVYIQKITEALGTEEAEADAEYNNDLNESIKAVQGVVLAINEYLEEIRYEIAGLESEQILE